MFEEPDDFFTDLLRACIDGSESLAVDAISKYGAPWPRFARRWFNGRPDAPVNGIYDSGKNPLAEALSRGRQDIALALMAAGARIDVADSLGATSVHWAARSGCPDFLRSASTRPRFSTLAATADSNGDTPLHAAALLPKDDCANILLACGSAPEAANKRSMRPLHYAAQSDSSACAQALLRAGDDPVSKDALGRTPLLIAALAGSPSAEILARPEALDEPDCGGLSPLATASRHGRIQIVRLLLSKGASPHPKAQGAMPPLSHACSGGHREIAQLLLDAGADIDAVDHLGRTASMIAAESDHRSLLDYLSSRGAKAHSLPLRQ